MVIKGDQLGTKIGFPTANIAPNGANQLIPQQGVYAVGVQIDDKMFGGMMNIGVRPTVSNTNENRIEINLFDFNADIYGKELRVKVYQHVRHEQAFESVGALKSQLEHDKTVWSLICWIILKLDA